MVERDEIKHELVRETGLQVDIVEGLMRMFESVIFPKFKDLEDKINTRNVYNLQFDGRPSLSLEEARK